MTREIVIVNYTAKKSSCNCFGDNIRHVMANTTKVTIVIKIATTSL